MTQVHNSAAIAKAGFASQAAAEAAYFERLADIVLEQMTDEESALLANLAIEVKRYGVGGIHLVYTFDGVDNLLHDSQQQGIVGSTEGAAFDRPLVAELRQVAKRQKRRRATKITADPVLDHLITSSGFTVEGYAAELKALPYTAWRCALRNSERPIRLLTELAGRSVTIIAANGKMTVSAQLAPGIAWHHNHLEVKETSVPATVMPHIAGKDINDIVENDVIAHLFPTTPVKSAAQRNGHHPALVFYL